MPIPVITMTHTLRERFNRVDMKRLRFWFQLAAFALLVYGGYAGIDLGDKLPTFACVFNSDARGGVCYLGRLQHELDHPLSHFMGFPGAMFMISLGVFVLLFLLLNKGWCGFVCPLGTLQDWITALRTRLGIRYSEYRWDQRKGIQSIKYILLVLLILLPLGIANPIPGVGELPRELSMPFCKICPGRTLLPLFAGDYSQFYIDLSSTTGMVMTGLGMAVTALFLVGAFVKKRFFCYLCPMSALHYLFAGAAAVQLVKDGQKCTRCGDCYRVCDMDIREIADDVTSRNLVTEDCMLCLKCVAYCPEPGALAATAGGKTFFVSTEEGFAARMGGAPHGEPRHD